MDCSDDRFGTNIGAKQGCLYKGKLRAESLGGKAGFTDEDMT